VDHLVYSCAIADRVGEWLEEDAVEDKGNDSRTISAQGAGLARCRPGVVGHQSGFSGGSLSEVVEKLLVCATRN